MEGIVAMSKQRSITETLLIAGRKTTIVDEILCGADVNTALPRLKCSRAA
jgi:hypothetical protein